MPDKPKHSAQKKTDLSWCVTKQKPELTSGNRQTTEGGERARGR